MDSTERYAFDNRSRRPLVWDLSVIGRLSGGCGRTGVTAELLNEHVSALQLVSLVKAAAELQGFPDSPSVALGMNSSILPLGLEKKRVVSCYFGPVWPRGDVDTRLRLLPSYSRVAW